MHIGWALGLLFLISCQPSVLKKLDKQSESTNLKIEGLASFQSSNEIHYRSKVDAFGQKLSGQLILKDQDTNFRAVMITDFGLKVMDAGKGLSPS